MTISAHAALQQLRDGNDRFVSILKSAQISNEDARPIKLVQEPKPFAIILSCADARVPPEILFDQRIGDLFVVRVAGNIAGPTQIGSIQFAAEVFGTRLVVVLGHSQCGAVLATLEYLNKNTLETLSPNLRSIVDVVRTSLEPLLKSEIADDHHALIRQAIRTNIGKSLRALRNDPDLAKLSANDGLMIIPAEYSMDSGCVEFLEEWELR